MGRLVIHRWPVGPGTDQFVYASIGGGDASDTATAVIRVLDPAKGTFFAPPRAKDWQIYAGWGKVSVEDLPVGMGMNNSQWGSSSTWIVGGGVPVQVTDAEQTVSVQVRNDPASPWAALKFHLTTQAAVGNYGPSDTTVDIVELVAQGTGTDGFVEYRGTFVPKSAGTYLPSIKFVWHDTDGNGPNSNHQSVVRDLEIFPSKDFVNKKFAGGASHLPVPGMCWKLSGQTVSITAPGEMVLVEVADLKGRLIAKLTHKDMVQWKHPKGAGALVVWARAGYQKCRFVLPVVGR